MCNDDNYLKIVYVLKIRISKRFMSCVTKVIAEFRWKLRPSTDGVQECYINLTIVILRAPQELYHEPLHTMS